MNDINDRKHRRHRRRQKEQSLQQPPMLMMALSFFMGCMLCSIMFLFLIHHNYFDLSTTMIGSKNSMMIRSESDFAVTQSAFQQNNNMQHQQQQEQPNRSNSIIKESRENIISDNKYNLLSGFRILIAIASFDFSQIPHLEEVLDTYHDLCSTSASKVDIVIHSSVPYPIALIDLWNTRFSFDGGCFSIQIVLVSPTIRLHLVDLHRPLFYEKLDEYDLFIYTEDDIRITPHTVSSYLRETYKLQELLGSKTDSYGYNVGIVRYEYNFPSNVAINDKTRHATQNVTRVYWEHSYHFPDAVPKVVDVVKFSHRNKAMENKYVHMKNHHQGMFFATPELLTAWKENPKCNFDVVTNRPGGHSQPKEGTQRVWMSSQQLLAPKHCGVQQVIPIDQFGSLTALHLPNKNYRRVGHFRNRTFSDGTESFDMHESQLLTSMNLHIELRSKLHMGTPQFPYRGITMIETGGERDKHWKGAQYELRKKYNSEEEYYEMVDRRMKDYNDYVARGGVLSEEDLNKTALVDIIHQE